MLILIYPYFFLFGSEINCRFYLTLLAEFLDYIQYQIIIFQEEETMNNGDLQDFYVFVQNNQHLQDLLGEAADKDSFTDLAVRLGEENGYSFTTENVQEFIDRKTTEVNLELKDEELEAVAGGRKKGCPGPFTTVCIITKSCWGSVC